MTEVNSKKLIEIAQSQKYVVLSFMTPSYRRQKELKEKISTTDSLDNKLKLYEDLFNITFSNVRAVNIRASFATYDLAREYIDVIKNKNQDNHLKYHLFIGENDKWLPFDENNFNADKQYLDEEMAKLAKDLSIADTESENELKKRIDSSKIKSK